MSNFLIWSESGDGAFLAQRLKNEGHKVRMYIKDPKSKEVFDGIVDKVNYPNPTRGDTVLFDMVRFGAQADQLRKQGIATVGASRFADLIELDRNEGTKLMQSFGIKVPETHPFKKISEGLAFLRYQKGTWFYKPSGNQDAGYTYGGEPDDLSRFMDFSGSTFKPDSFILQKKIEGTEISLEGWFDGKRFVYPFNSTIEDKRFLVGDKGPRTGCMANVVWAYEDPRPILALKTLKRIELALETAGHVGPIDLNMILDSEGCPYGLEWSPRFGYDALQALSLLMPGDLGSQLERFARGQLDGFNVRDDLYALTINVSIPPFPHYHIAKEMYGFKLDPMLLGYPGKVMLRDVMLPSPGQPAIAGADCCVASIGETGTDVVSLRQSVLELVGKFKIPNAQYRTDPVVHFEDTISALRKFGYDIPKMEPIKTVIRNTLYD